MFDIDGTLLDHDGALRPAVCRWWLIGSHLATQNQCDEGLVALWDDVAGPGLGPSRPKQTIR